MLWPSCSLKAPNNIHSTFVQRRNQSPWCGGHQKKGRRECSSGELRADVSAWLRKAVPAVCHPGIHPKAARMEEKSELQIPPGDLNCLWGLGQGLAAHSGQICEQAPGQSQDTGQALGAQPQLGGYTNPQLWVLSSTRTSPLPSVGSQDAQLTSGVAEDSQGLLTAAQLCCVLHTHPQAPSSLSLWECHNQAAAPSRARCGSWSKCCVLRTLC